MISSKKKVLVVGACVVGALMLFRYWFISPSPLVTKAAPDYLSQLQINKERDIRLAQLDVVRAANHYILAIDQEESERLAYIARAGKAERFGAALDAVNKMVKESAVCPPLSRQKLNIDIAANELHTAYWAYLLQARRIELRYKRLGLATAVTAPDIPDDIVKIALAQLEKKDQIIDTLIPLGNLPAALSDIDVEALPQESIQTVCTIEARVEPGIPMQE